jgi:ribosomal protein L11 methyltransferase
LSVNDEKIDTLSIAHDVLTSLAGQAGFESFIDTDKGIDGYVQTTLFDKEILDEGLNDFPVKGFKITYLVEEVEDKDWNAEWEKGGFDPINIEDKCIIYDAKHADEISSSLSLSSNKILIGIDAIQAFGTGTHNTTMMLVSTLINTELCDKRVLDCGCGTGILGITAAKCGAKHVVCYDIDEWSVENTKHNAEINNITNIDVYLGNSNVLSHVDGVFDIVIANINRNVLLADMHSFKEVMAHEATLILSGFYEEDAKMLIEKANSLGLNEVSRKTDDNWCSLIFK